MLHRLRVARPLAGLLVLLVFGAWLGTAWFHHHGASPCDVCKLLQATPAALPDGPPVVARDAGAQRLEPAALVAGAIPTPLLPPGRAPPSL